jgi:hypothetical protein
MRWDNGDSFSSAGVWKAEIKEVNNDRRGLG